MSYLIDPNRPKKQKDWEGRFVRLKRDIESGGGRIFSAGSVMKVRRYHGKMYLETVEMCDKCGQGTRPGIIGKLENDVELLDSHYEFRGEHYPVKASVLYEILRSVREDYAADAFSAPETAPALEKDNSGGNAGLQTAPAPAQLAAAGGARIACDLIEQRLRELVGISDTKYARQNYGVKI